MLPLKKNLNLILLLVIFELFSIGSAFAESKVGDIFKDKFITADGIDFPLPKGNWRLSNISRISTPFISYAFANVDQSSTIPLLLIQESTINTRWPDIPCGSMSTESSVVFFTRHGSSKNSLVGKCSGLALFENFQSYASFTPGNSKIKEIVLEKLFPLTNNGSSSIGIGVNAFNIDMNNGKKYMVFSYSLHSNHQKLFERISSMQGADYTALNNWNSKYIDSLEESLLKKRFKSFADFDNTENLQALFANSGTKEIGSQNLVASVTENTTRKDTPIGQEDLFETVRKQAEKEFEETSLAQESRIRELERILAEPKAKEQIRLADEARTKEQQRIALEAQQKEQLRLAQEARQKEQELQLAEQKAKEQLLIAEETRVKEQQRIAFEAQQKEQVRLAQEARVKEQELLLAEQKDKEQLRLAEERRTKEQQRLAFEAQQKEQVRLAQEARQKEQERLMAEQQAKEQLRLAEETRIKNQQRLALESTEISRLRAEAEESKRKQAELEEQLKLAKQQNQVTPPSAMTTMANRKALVIGNDTYKSVSKLLNAREDAKAIAASLSTVGYQVTLKLDLNEKEMKAALRAFSSQVQGGDEVMFFFAGHGVQLGAANYLLPIDIGGESEAQVKDEAIQLQRILDDMSEKKSKFTLAMIDACRDNPFKTAGRAIGGRGMAPTTAATGQMVVFSAGTGQQALDRLGNNDKNKNGVFTRTFLKEMQKSGVSIDRIVKNVRNEVAELAKSVGHDQVPAIYDQVLGDFYFKK